MKKVNPLDSEITKIWRQMFYEYKKKLNILMSDLYSFLINRE